MSVLIAENHPGSGPALAVLLDAAGYRVSLARSYAAATATLDSDRPHILLADVHLPGGCGTDLIARARATIPGVFCLAMTGDPDPGIRRAALAAGADAFLPKPIEIREVLRAIPPPRVEGAN